jgi:hypothetical protein
VRQVVVLQVDGADAIDGDLAVRIERRPEGPDRLASLPFTAATTRRNGC